MSKPVKVNIKLPTIPDSIREKLTEDEQLVLQKAMLTSSIDNIVTAFKRTPTVTLSGNGGFYERIEAYKNTLG